LTVVREVIFSSALRVVTDPNVRTTLAATTLVIEAL